MRNIKGQLLQGIEMMNRKKLGLIILAKINGI